MNALRRRLARDLLLLQLLAACCVTPANAALGDTLATVGADFQQLEAGARGAARTDFSVHELRTPAGTVIREYVGASGVVFAVSWQGPAKPSMPRLRTN